MSTTTTLGKLLHADVDSWDVAKKIYLFNATESGGEQIYVSEKGKVQTIGLNNAPKNVDGSWDGWHFVFKCDGEIPSNWEIDRFSDENGNLKYRDGANPDGATAYDSEEDCFSALVDEYGVPEDFHDEIMDTIIEVE